MNEANYLLRVKIGEDDQDKTPFMAFGDTDAVLKGIEAAMNLASVFKVTHFVIDTMVLGCVVDGMITTNYPTRLFDSNGDSDLNLIEDDSLPDNLLDFVQTIRKGG